MNIAFNFFRTGVSTFASHTSPSTNQSLQKSFHLSHPDKIELKKISSPSENKKYASIDRHKNENETNYSIYFDIFRLRTCKYPKNQTVLK
jgi:hypothetical protein